MAAAVAWGAVLPAASWGEQANPPATRPAASAPSTQPFAADTAQLLIVLTTDSNPPADRLSAASKLLQLKASDALQGVLTKGSPTARKVVCEAVRLAPAPEMIDALVTQLGESDASVAAFASQALAAFHDNGVVLQTSVNH